MKAPKLLFSLLVISTIAKAQLTNSATNADVDRLNVRVSFGPPVQDTIAAPYKLGEFRTRPQDKLWYRFNGNTTGRRWDYIYFGPSSSIIPTLDNVLIRGNTSSVGMTVGPSSFTSIKVPSLGQVGQLLMATISPDGSLGAQTIPGGGTLINSINTLTASAQFLAVNFNVATAPKWTSATATHTLTLPLASTVDTGIVIPAQVTLWNGKYTLPGGGTTAQYIRGDGTLLTFPTIPAQLNPTAAGGGITITGTYPNLTFTVSGAGGGISSLIGDVTASGTGAVAATISANVVSYAKMQQAAASRLLGNPTGSTANISEVPVGFGLLFNSGSLKVDTASLGTLTSLNAKVDKVTTLHIGPTTSDLSINRTFLASIIDSLQVVNKGGAARWAGGTYASRPPFVLSGGYFYYVTDSNRLSYNNGGSTWTWMTDRVGNIDSLAIQHNSLWTMYPSTDGKTLFDKGFNNSGNVVFKTEIDSTLSASVQVPMVAMYNEMRLGVTTPLEYEGNSITAGVGATDTAHAYSGLIWANLGIPYTIHAVSNSTPRDVVSRLFTNRPASKVATSLSIMIGINQLREDNSSQRQAAITQALKVAIVNQFIDSAWAISDTKVTKSAGWTNFSVANMTSKSIAKSLGNPMKSNTAGSTLTFNWSDNNLWIGTYGWAASHNLGSFSVTIDGVAKGTYSGKDLCSDFSSQINTYDYRAPIVFGFTGLGAGLHTVVITLLEAKEVDFDYIAKTMTVDNCKSVFIWHITKCTPAGWVAYGSTYGSDLAVDTANRNTDTLVNYFRQHGFPIGTVHSNQFMNIATSGTSDGLHPANPGHIQLYKAFIPNLNLSSSGIVSLVLGRTATYNSVTPTSGTGVNIPLADDNLAGLESPTEHVMMGHPIVFKNAPGAGDSLWYASIDTALLKRIIAGPGILTVPATTSLTFKVDSNWIKNLNGWGGAGGSGMVDPGSNGILVRTANNTTISRSLTGTANRIVITNADGVAASPTFDIGVDVVTLTGTQTLTNKSIATTQLTGTLQAAQFPALTGPVTTVAGGLATSIANLAITNAMLAGSIDLTTKMINILPGANGGTGINNAGKTLSLGGNTAFIGAFTVALTSTNTTNLTLPTSGTLLTTTGSGAGLTGIPLTIAGTVNQVIASASTGAITLSLPQAIASTSSPTFTGLTLTSLITGGAIGVVMTNNGVLFKSQVLDPTYGGTGLNNGTNTISLGANLLVSTTAGAGTNLVLTTTGNTNVTLPTSGTLLVTNGVGSGLSGIVTTLTGTNNQINVSSSTGAIILTLPQAIATTSTPTFASVIMGGTSVVGQVWTATGTSGQGAWATSSSAGTVALLYSGMGLTQATNTATETSMFAAGFGTSTLPANFLTSGKTLRIRAAGTFSTLSPTPGTLTMNFKIGGVTVASEAITNLVASSLDQPWVFEVLITCPTPGSSGLVFIGGQLNYTLGTSGQGVAQYVTQFSNNGNSATINTTTTQAVNLTVQWATANTSNAWKCTTATIESLN